MCRKAESSSSQAWPIVSLTVSAGLDQATPAVALIAVASSVRRTVPLKRHDYDSMKSRDLLVGLTAGRRGSAEEAGHLER